MCEQQRSDRGAAAGDGFVNADNDAGANDADDELRNAEARSARPTDVQKVSGKPANECANDAANNVRNRAHRGIRLHDHRGNPPDDRSS